MSEAQNCNHDCGSCTANCDSRVPDKKSFEEKLARLEEIVALLEKGDAALAASLSLFEEGTALVKSAGKLLDDAELKVVKLMKGPDGAPVETEFEDHD